MHITVIFTVLEDFTLPHLIQVDSTWSLGAFLF